MENEKPKDPQKKELPLWALTIVLAVFAGYCIFRLRDFSWQARLALSSFLLIYAIADAVVITRLRKIDFRSAYNPEKAAYRQLSLWMIVMPIATLLPLAVLVAFAYVYSWPAWTWLVTMACVSLVAILGYIYLYKRLKKKSEKKQPDEQNTSITKS